MTRTVQTTALLAALAMFVAACSSDASPPADTAESAVDQTDVSSDSVEETTETTERTETTDSTVPLPELDAAPGWTDPSGAILRFVDVTDEAGVDVTFSSALEVELVKDTAIMMGGAGAADFDNDGDTDMFVLGGGNERDSLFINDGQGKFSDATVAAGLDDLHLGAGVAVGDYNGDGWLDIFVTSHGTPEGGAMVGAHRLYRNNGDLTFSDVAVDAGVSTTSLETHDGLGAVFGDIDLDGDLDLFVAGWQRDSVGNRLFLNNGDSTFTDVTEDAGILDNGIRGFSPCIVDMNGDRLPEILLVADFGTTEYFVNRGGGQFVAETSAAGVYIVGDDMGTAVADVNNDGLLDWYVTAIADADGVGRGEGNKLFINQGDGTFADVAAAVGVADGGWGWGAVFVDANNDGWLDIIETNGWDLPSYVGNLSRTWIADGAGGFTDVAEQAGPLHNLHGLGVIQFDSDGDGDQDIAITSSNDDFTLYRNDLAAADAKWLRVFLDTSAADELAPNGVGAMVRARIGDVQFTQTIGGCSNFNTTSELSAHFGLGNVDTIDELVVEWPNGEMTTLIDVEPNQTLTITAP